MRPDPGSVTHVTKEVVGQRPGCTMLLEGSRYSPALGA